MFRWSDQKVRLKLTTSYYLTPKGRKIERRLQKDPEQGEGGILPDELVDFPDKKQRTAVIARLYKREVPPLYQAQVDALQKEFPSIQMLQPLPPGQDVQLAHALEILRQLAPPGGKKK